MLKKLGPISIALATTVLAGCITYSRYSPDTNLIEKKSAAILRKDEGQKFGTSFSILPVKGEIYPAGLNTIKIFASASRGVFQVPSSATFEMQCNLESGKVYSLEGTVENDRVRVWIVERNTSLVVSKIYIADLEQGPSVATELPILKKK